MSSRNIKLNGISVLSGVLLSASALPAYAQNVVDFDELVISAGQTPSEKQLTGSTNTVVTAEQIQRSGATYAADAIRLVPGVSVSQSGSTGTVTQIRIRGAEASHTLVIIDGIEMNSPGDGEFDFSRLLAADIERIEVVRGAQSGIYGSNAHAGVINIITRSGRGKDGFTAHGFAEYGSFDTFTGGAGFYGSTDAIDAAFNVAHNQTDGFNIAPTGNEDDGARTTTISGKVGADLGEHFRIESVLRYVDRLSQFDDQFTQFVTDGNNESNGEDLAGRITLLGNFHDGAVTTKTQYSGSQTELVSFFGAPAFFFGQEATRLNYSQQIDYRFSSRLFDGTNHTITGLIEHETEEFEQFGPFAAPLLTGTQRRAFTGLAGEYRIEFGDLGAISAAIRHDFNEDPEGPNVAALGIQKFEDETTWRITGARLFPSHGVRLHGSVGRAVTNPSMIEQFGFFPPFVGNPSLRPESSISWDIGVEKAFHDGALVVDVTYYSARLQDEIATRFIMGASTAINLVGRSKREGVEVTATWRPSENWEIYGNYTYLNAKEPDGSREIRRPEHAANLSITHLFHQGRGRITANARYNGEMPDTVFTFPVAGRAILDDFLVVGLNGSYEVREGVEIFGRIENLFDEQYQEIFSFETADFAAYAGIRVQLGGAE